MDVDKIIAFEDGTISDEDLVVLFQGLVDTGQAWTLQGFYGRTACQLIARDHVTVKDEDTVPPMAKEHIRAIREDLRASFQAALQSR